MTDGAMHFVRNDDSRLIKIHEETSKSTKLIHSLKHSINNGKGSPTQEKNVVSIKEMEINECSLRFSREAMI